MLITLRAHVRVLLKRFVNKSKMRDLDCGPVGPEDLCQAASQSHRDVTTVTEDHKGLRETSLSCHARTISSHPSKSLLRI
jgi:hypothetical protein